MAQLIKPGDIKVITKNNELFVNISLELNIKLDGNVTNLNVGSSNSTSTNKIEEEKVDWVIPDFTSGVGKLSFGKET